MSEFQDIAPCETSISSTSRGKFQNALGSASLCTLPARRCLDGISFKLLFCQGLHHSSWNFQAKKRIKISNAALCGCLCAGSGVGEGRNSEINFLGAFPAWCAWLKELLIPNFPTWNEPAESSSLRARMLQMEPALRAAGRPG